MKNQFAHPIHFLVLVGLVAMFVGFAGSGTAWGQTPGPTPEEPPLPTVDLPTLTIADATVAFEKSTSKDPRLCNLDIAVRLHAISRQNHYPVTGNLTVTLFGHVAPPKEGDAGTIWIAGRQDNPQTPDNEGFAVGEISVTYHIRMDVGDMIQYGFSTPDPDSKYTGNLQKKIKAAIDDLENERPVANPLRIQDFYGLVVTVLVSGAVDSVNVPAHVVPNPMKLVLGEGKGREAVLEVNVE